MKIAETYFAQNAVFGLPVTRMTVLKKIVALVEKGDQKSKKTDWKKLCRKSSGEVKIGPIARDASRFTAWATRAIVNDPQL